MPRVAFRCPPTLCYILIHPYSSPLMTCYQPYNRNRCNSCRILQLTTMLQHWIQIATYKINENITWLSTHIIYQINFNGPVIYIGQTTQPLPERIYNHHSIVELFKTQFAIAAHTQSHNTNNCNQCFTMTLLKTSIPDSSEAQSNFGNSPTHSPGEVLDSSSNNCLFPNTYLFNFLPSTSSLRRQYAFLYVDMYSVIFPLFWHYLERERGGLDFAGSRLLLSNDWHAIVWILDCVVEMGHIIKNWFKELFWTPRPTALNWISRVKKREQWSEIDQRTAIQWGAKSSCSPSQLTPFKIQGMGQNLELQMDFDLLKSLANVHKI